MCRKRDARVCGVRRVFYVYVTPRTLFEHMRHVRAVRTVYGITLFSV